jgi:hypothetical protein
MNITESIKLINSVGSDYFTDIRIGWNIPPNQITVGIECDIGLLIKTFATFEEVIIGIGEVIEREIANGRIINRQPKDN